MISITYTDFAIPDVAHPLEDFVTRLDVSYFNGELSQQDILHILKVGMGVKEVFVGERREEAQLFSGLLERYFRKNDPDPADIGYIIYTRGDSVAVGDPWSLTEGECVNVPYFLQERFGMTNAQVFNVEQECSGTLIALKIAWSLLTTDEIKKVLILSRNFFEGPDKRLMGGAILVSDGVGILEVSREPEGLEMIDFVACTSGKISKVRDLASAANMEEVFTTGVNLIRELLDRNGLSVDEVAWLIPQNLSRNSWNLYCQMLSFPKERVFLDNVTAGGHLGDVDIIRNISGLVDKGVLRRGDFVIVYGLGTGTSWNAVLLKAII